RLDGLPLALELAAARAHVLEPGEMLQWVERNLTELSWDAPDLPPRQRSLRAALTWSLALLSPAEQALFRRLAVFVGGCTREAVEAITDLDQLGREAMVPMASLVDVSLVMRSDHSAEGGGSACSRPCASLRGKS